jgi:hypothetical protein
VRKLLDGNPQEKEPLGGLVAQMGKQQWLILRMRYGFIWRWIEFSDGLS